jgi:hypothetical protein
MEWFLCLEVRPSIFSTYHSPYATKQARETGFLGWNLFRARLSIGFLMMLVFRVTSIEM